MNDIITKRLRIHGRVQGVYYRDWARQAAKDLGVSGWVRNNENDGSVELLATGQQDVVEHFIADCHEGPLAARVNAVDVHDGIPEGANGFEIISTI